MDTETQKNKKVLGYEMTPLQVWRTCTRKIKFKTKAKVRKAAKKSKRADVWFYQCPICEQWHLTKQNQHKGKRND